MDRESAYELLTAKIKQAQEEDAQKRAKEERKKLDREEKNYQKRRSTKRSSRMHPLEKVLTSPTVIRSILGILNKMIK